MNPPMDCPRCGQPGVMDAACPRCGVIVAKARPRAGTTPAASTAPAGLADTDRLIMQEEAPAGTSGLKMILAAVLLVVAGAVGSRQWDRIHRRPGPAREAAEASRAPLAGAGTAPAIEGPLPSLHAAIEVPLQNLSAGSIATDADRAGVD